MFLTNKLSLPALLTALALIQPACSSGDKQDAEAEDNLAVDEDAGLEGNNQSANGNATPTKNNSNQSENIAESDANENSEKKTPISEDGYDDDWNNLNSQQQKANNNKNNKKNQIANEEPPLENEGFGQQQQQNAPFQQVVEQPVQQFVEQVPLEEPPLDLEPAPVAEIQVPEPAPEPAAVVSTTVVSGAPLIKHDTEPVFAMIHWVGYDYLEKDSVVRVEIVTRGSPRYNLFQERNKSDQPELVLRFFNTQLRHKVRRDIDASEFRSPVAYVRMRADEAENSVDVIITLRDGVKPRMFSKYGNILLTFPIPDHYFGNAAIGSAPIAKAEILANANIMPDLDEASEIPEGLRIAKAFVNNPGKDALGSVPNDAGEPVVTDELPVSNGVSNNVDMLPADFSNGAENPVQNINNFGGINANNGGSNVGGNGNYENAGFNNYSENQGGNENFESNTGSNQEDGEYNDFQGEPAQGADDFDFGGGQPQEGATGGNNFNESELNGDASGSSEQQEGTGDELDEDSLNNYEDDGGNQEDIDKFDVRNKVPASPLALFAGFIVSQVSINAVAQDDFNEDFEQDQGNSQQNGGLNQGGNPELGNVAAQGDIENSSLGLQNSGGDANGNFNSGGNANGNFNSGGNENSGEGNFGDNGDNSAGSDDDFLNEGYADSDNFGNGGSNNFGNTGGNTFPANNAGGNVPNTTLNSGNNATGVNTFNTMNSGNSFNGNAAPNTVEPFQDAGPDLAGPETEGSETENVEEGSAGGRKVKLDFRGAPLRDVIRVLSDESGVNFVYAPAVANTNIYISLIDIPFNDALKALLSSHALGMVSIGPNIVKIDTLAAIAVEKQNIETRRVAELMTRPTKILVHRMSYARAESVSTMLLPMLQAASANDTRIKTQFDVRTNSVIINAVPEVLAVAKALLDRIDLETPQVKIASRIVEVIKTAGDRFGVSWGTPFNFDQGRGLGFGNLVFPNYMLSRYTVDAGGATPSRGNMQFRLGSLNNAMALDLALSMEQAKGTTELLQSNDLTVEDNTPAVINAGRKDFLPAPVLPNGERGQPFPIDYLLTMSVTPHLTSDGAIQMQLDITSNSPGKAASPEAIAATNSKSIKTSLLRRSGETAVIGGVYSSEIAKEESGVPFFSSIPIIGALFRTRDNSEIKRELLIMVTPTIMPSIGKGYSSDEPASISASIGNNMNSGLNNFNSNNQSNSNFDSNSNNNWQSNNNNGSGNSNQGNSNQGNNQNSGNENQNQFNDQSNDDE